MSRDRPEDDRTRDGFPELEDAMALWREDAARAAARVDVHGDLADRVVAGVLDRPTPVGAPRTTAPRSSAARWYAMAAVLLIGVGVAGTLVMRLQAADEPTPIRRWAAVEEELIDALARDPQSEPGLGR